MEGVFGVYNRLFLEGDDFQIHSRMGIQGSQSNMRGLTSLKVMLVSPSVKSFHLIKGLTLLLLTVKMFHINPEPHIPIPCWDMIGLDFVLLLVLKKL